MMRGGHAQGGSRNTPFLALLTGHFLSNTHTISVRAELTSLKQKHSLGPMELTSHLEFNDSHVKCTSLQFVVNTNHMKVANDSIGPCDSHVT